MKRDAFEARGYGRIGAPSPESPAGLGCGCPFRSLTDSRLSLEAGLRQYDSAQSRQFFSERSQGPG